MMSPRSAGQSAARRSLVVMLIVFVISVACPALLPARTQFDPAVVIELYNDACSHYEQDDFAGAMDRFLAAALTRCQNPDLFYNLGNCYFRMRDFGHAILNYEKARRLAPRDASIAHNLSLARSSIVDKIEPPHHNILAQMLLDIYSLFNVNEWTIVSLSLYVAFMALLIAFVILKGKPRGMEARAGRDKTRKIILRIAVIFLILVLFCGINTGIKAHSFSNHNYGIVVSDLVKARSGPRDEFAKVFELHSGTEVRVRNKVDNWYQISIQSGLTGWVPQKSVETI